MLRHMLGVGLGLNDPCRSGMCEDPMQLCASNHHTVRTASDPLKPRLLERGMAFANVFYKGWVSNGEAWINLLEPGSPRGSKNSAEAGQAHGEVYGEFFAGTIGKSKRFCWSQTGSHRCVSNFGGAHQAHCEHNWVLAGLGRP